MNCCWLKEVGLENVSQVGGNDAVLALIKQAIQGAKRNRIKIGICGQASSDFPEFTQFLIEQGIDTISVTPDVFVKTDQLIRRLKVQSKK